MGRRSLKTIDVEDVDDLAERHCAVPGTPSPLRTGSRLREGDHTGGPWRSLDDPELATLEWVDWFNHRRLFGALGHVPPAEHEAGCYSSHVPAKAGTQQTESP